MICSLSLSCTAACLSGEKVHLGNSLALLFVPYFMFGASTVHEQAGQLSCADDGI